MYTCKDILSPLRILLSSQLGMEKAARNWLRSHCRILPGLFIIEKQLCRFLGAIL
jgi:hypothetical protein